MKIILTRHGETQWPSRGSRFHGRLDLAMSNNGLWQARAAAERIGTRWRPAAVYTSPLRRCVATGQIIGEALNLQAQQTAGLVDMDYGHWQGLTPEEARTGWPEEFALWLRAPHRAHIPGGESLHAVHARVTTAFRELLGQHRRDAIVIIGHSSVNRMFLAYAMGLPLARYRCLAQDYCAITEMHFAQGAFQIKLLNDTAHLISAGVARARRPDSPAHGVATVALDAAAGPMIALPLSGPHAPLPAATSDEVAS